MFPSFSWSAPASSSFNFNFCHFLPHITILSFLNVSIPLCSLLSCTFFDTSVTLILFLIVSFLILSNLVTPQLHLSILISATYLIYRIMEVKKKGNLHTR
uniref:Uncharacterized protein n=1 Tax=Cacopsylla melanoneura TaxID=428564 RepID=A0A8D8LME9_9HEMI